MIRLLLIVFLSTCFISFSQENLVRDSSFEKCKNCHSGIVTNCRKYPLKYWTIPNNATSDYFYNNGKVGSVPNNFNGYQYPRSGNGYAGIGVLKRWKEYVQTKLSEKLVKDSIYLIRFFVSLAEGSEYSISGLGAFLSNEEIHINSYEKIDVTPCILEVNNIKDTADWIEISGSYKANGSEQFLIMGSFGESKKDFKKRKVKFRKPKMKKCAYYYIDDASVQLASVENILKDTIIEPASKLIPIPNKTTFLLPSFSFNTNESTLLKSSLPTLDSLAMALKTLEQVYCVIEGHTDNIGDSIYNVNLSLTRANEVMKYLISKGIEPDRLSTKGFGESVPIVDNNTEEGRGKNRRVEIKFYRKDD